MSSWRVRTIYRRLRVVRIRRCCSINLHGMMPSSLTPAYFPVARNFVSFSCHNPTRLISTQVILPDYLTGNPYSSLNQPVWCSYANGARSSVVVASAGHVFYQQGWLNTDQLRTAIDAYWKQDGHGTWIGENDIPSPLGSVAKGKATKPKAGKGRGSPKNNKH